MFLTCLQIIATGTAKQNHFESVILLLCFPLILYLSFWPDLTQAMIEWILPIELLPKSSCQLLLNRLKHFIDTLKVPFEVRLLC